jgi:predicted dehydrogenase
MDMLFHVVGAPSTISAEVVNQFPNITIAETGKTQPTTTPDQVLVIGSLANGGVFTIQIEGGKRNNSGLQIDITGTKGDLKISNALSFQNPGDNSVEGSQANGESLRPLAIPPQYSSLPASTLDASVLDLAHLYAAYAQSREDDTYRAPNFADALWMHRLIDLISIASLKGHRQTSTQNNNH